MSLCSIRLAPRAYVVLRHTSRAFGYVQSRIRQTFWDGLSPKIEPERHFTV